MRQHVNTKLYGKGPEGLSRRWFWRIAFRYGDRWWYTPDPVARRELRMMSWRRAL